MRSRFLTILAILAAAVLATGLSAQESARDRARRALPVAVFEDLERLADSQAAAGVPEGPLFNKALEGTAKRVPAGALLPAIRAYARRLGEARGAFGPEAPVPLLVAGADALQRGVASDDLRALEPGRARSPLAVLVLAELVESGVPPDRALAVLREALAQRADDGRVLDIPVRVRRLIRDGRAPRDAAEQIRRLLRDRRGGADLGPPVPPGSEPPVRGRRPGGAPPGPGRAPIG